MKSALSISTLVAAGLLAVSSLSFAQAGGGSSGGPQAGSEAALDPSGRTLPSGGTAAGGMVQRNSGAGMTSNRMTTEKDMSPAQKQANKEKRTQAVNGTGNPSGVPITDGKSANLPHDQMGKTMTKGNRSPSSMDSSGGTVAGPMTGGTSSTADKGPVMGEGNGPSGVAPAAGTSKNLPLTR